MQYAKVRSKKYKSIFSAYEEDIDGTLDEDQRLGKY